MLADDPNATGGKQAKPVRDDRAGPVTPADTYDEKTPFYGKKPRPAP